MNVSESDIKCCIRKGAQKYFEGCRSRIPAFTSQHFCYPGAIHTNRVAFGWDILRAPLNLFWAPIYALLCILRFAIKNNKHFTKISSLLDSAPSGLTTKVQARISTLIMEELLQHNNEAQSLTNCIIEELQRFYENQENSDLDTKQFHLVMEPLVQEALVQYQVTRTASADITNTLSCAILGAFTFKKFTPGGIGLGLITAALLAKKLAADNFFLGTTLGKIYYGIFPPKPTLAIASFSTLLVMACLSVIAAFSGIVTDPIQAQLGIHQKRLHKMIDHMEKDFLESTRSSFRPKDQFLARILDALDLIKSSLT